MSNDLIEKIEARLKENGLAFTKKPIVIGGMAMEYYGMRKSGADIDLVISIEDYVTLCEAYPEQRKDIYGDLGLVISEFEIWRSIALMDYNFFRKDAIEEGELLMISIDRLLWTRVCAMDVEKYRNDLYRIKDYYNEQFHNNQFYEEAKTHSESYEKSCGVIFGGNYLEV